MTVGRSVSQDVLPILNAQQRQHYADKGWLVLENVFAPDVVEAIARYATQMAEDDLRENEQLGDYAIDRAADGNALPRKIASPFLRDKRYRQFVMQEKLTAILAELLGSEALLATDQIFMKPPRHGTAKPFHQDNFYFQVTPVDQLITAWIALDDVDQENGCLQYINGSHHDGILPHTPVHGEEYNLTPAVDLVDMSRRSFAPVKKGGVVFHHGATLHKSEANHSSRWRRAYATHWVTAQTQSQSNIFDNAYFKDDYAATQELSTPIT